MGLLGRNSANTNTVGATDPGIPLPPSPFLPFPHLFHQIPYPASLSSSLQNSQTKLLDTGATGHRYETRSHGPLSSTGPGIGAGRTNNMGTTTSSTGMTGNGAYTGTGMTGHGMGSTNTIGGGRAAVAPAGTGVQGSRIPNLCSLFLKSPDPILYSSLLSCARSQP